MSLPIPPWRIKGVEPVPAPTSEERVSALEKAQGNLFHLPSHAVTVDLLTDSGTGAMSQSQWAALMEGDESYAGSRSFHQLEKSVREIFGFHRILPAHQGRAAEEILFGTFGRKGGVVVSNHLFDTTTAHAHHVGMETKACVVQEGLWGGNFDLGLLENQIREGNVDLLVATVTCNSTGGLPVSLKNLRAVYEIARAHHIRLWVDMARIAENSYFQWKAGEGESPLACAKATCDLMDGGWMSAKKDGLVNMGGFIALRHGEHYEELAERGILSEGFPTYGGMSGRGMASLAVGLWEAMDERYLTHRIGEVRDLHDRLAEWDVPMVSPGGHAVFVDAGAWLPHLKPTDFPGQSLALALYLVAGIRSSEIGSLLAGRDLSGEQIDAHGEYTRLAIPRRTYTAGHRYFVSEAFRILAECRESIPPILLAKESPSLRHFQSTFERFLWTPSQFAKN
ncbi:tryptophanase [bacterium]|nr:tryptophanase [bacterium]